MALSHSPQIVRDGLVLYLDAANPKSYSGTGTTWTDIKSNTSGSLINGVSFDYANRGVLNFDGIDDYVDLGNSSLLNSTINGATNWTICYWCNPLNVGRILDRGNIGVDPTSSLELNTNSIGRNNTADLSFLSQNITNGGWVYICITKNTSLELSWYVNGIFSNSTTFLGEFGGSGIWKIGRRAFNTSNIYNGGISIIQIYNKVLDVNEIKQNFEALRGRYGI